MLTTHAGKPKQVNSHLKGSVLFIAKWLYMTNNGQHGSCKWSRIYSSDETATSYKESNKNYIIQQVSVDKFILTI